MLLASIVTVGCVLVQYTEVAPLPAWVWFQRLYLTHPQRFTAERSACFSMILRPYFIYFAFFLIFQIWLSGQ